MKSSKTWRSFLVWATAVLLLAAALRLLALQDVPPGLAQDEVLNADIVTFIRGGYHRFFFPEGYGHEPLYHYWSVPFQVLLGDNFLSVRLPAVFLGLLLVALTMRWVRREFGVGTAVVTGVGLAISWWPIIFSRVGLRPIAEPVLLVAFAWFWPRRPWLAGFLLGLSLYTYTGARVVFLIPLLLAAYALLRARQQRHSPRKTTFLAQLRAALIVLGVTVLLAVPLALTLRADPAQQQRVQQLAGPLQALQQGDAGPILESTLATLGVFSIQGDPRWTYTLPGQPLFGPVTAVFFYAGLLLALLRLREPPYAFILIWLLVGLIPSAVTPDAPSTVRLVGAMPVVYLLPALTVAWLWQRTASSRLPLTPAYLRLGLAIGVAGLGLATLLTTLQTGLGRWPQALETRLKYQSVLLDMARHQRLAGEGSTVVATDFFRPITVDSLRRNLNADPQARWVQTGSEVAGALVLPVEGNGRLYVPEYAPPHASLLQAAGMDDRPLHRSSGNPAFAVYALPNRPAIEHLSTPVSFAEQIKLVGYEISPARAGHSLQMLTTWQVEAPLPDDLALFLHLFDGHGQLIAQHDGLDAAAAQLRTGDVLVQRHLIALPAALPAGDYRVNLGAYRRGSGQRLMHDDLQAVSEDSVTLPVWIQN